MRSINDSVLTGIEFNGGKSYRSILLSDNMGFSMMKTVINKGGPYFWHYKHHKEACYCISGNGCIKDLSNDELINVSPGVTYLIDKNQPHEFNAYSEVILISVFYPGLFGDETHDKEGNYFSRSAYKIIREKYSKICDVVMSSKSKYDAVEELIKLNL